MWKMVRLKRLSGIFWKKRITISAPNNLKYIIHHKNIFIVDEEEFSHYHIKDTFGIFDKLDLIGDIPDCVGHTFETSEENLNYVLSHFDEILFDKLL